MRDSNLKNHQDVSEIDSFNPQVPDLQTLLELDEADLEQVTGAGGCCGSYGGCVNYCWNKLVAVSA